MNSPSLSEIKVTTITDPGGFDALESEWEALHAESTATVFQSYAWLRAWWRHFGEPFSTRELHLIEVRQEWASGWHRSVLHSIGEDFVDGIHAGVQVCRGRIVRLSGCHIVSRVRKRTVKGHGRAYRRAVEASGLGQAVRDPRRVSNKQVVRKASSRRSGSAWRWRNASCVRVSG